MSIQVAESHEKLDPSAPVPQTDPTATPSACDTSHLERADDERINWRTSLSFLGFHFLPLLAIFTGVTWKSVLLGFALYSVRLLAITAGFHRYFSHRAYKLGRVTQFIVAWIGTSAAQKGPLWWAAHHRGHHRNSDTTADIHSPRKGFWWSHVGWILCDRYSATDHESIRDFSRFPELEWLNKHYLIPPWTLALAALAIGGWSGLVVGFFGSTVLLWHATFTVNSLAHVMGRRRYTTTDTSRNSWLIALWTGGEGWHNNHHRFQASARNGFQWWEYDPTFYAIKILSWLGLAHDLKTVPKVVLEEGKTSRRTPRERRA